MEKNQEFDSLVHSLGSNGEGIIKDGEYTVFVPYALPTEKIRCKILKVKKHIAYGKTLEVYTPSDDRVRPRCQFFSKCGGCQLQHVKYKEQLKFKTKLVKDCLKKIAFLNCKVKPTIRSDFEYNYRNKMQLPIRSTHLGNKIGFFAENSHRIVPINGCVLHSGWSNDVIEVMSEFINRTGISCFDEETQKGVLKHVVVREIVGKLMITVVITQDCLDNEELLVELFKAKFHNFTLYININKLNNNVVLGKEFRLVYGNSHMKTQDFGITYYVGPESFIQVNDNVKKKLYNEIKKVVNPDEETVVIDAYSGCGVLTAVLAQKAKRAIGIEIVAEAVESADKLAYENGLSDKIKNICAPCEEVLPQIIKDIADKGEKSVLILDPPRKGVDVSVIEAIKAVKPQKIVYVSCSPQTLARDLGLITGTLEYHGAELEKTGRTEYLYDVISVQPLDMFPQTKNVETLVCLSHKKPDGHISVNVEFGEEEG